MLNRSIVARRLGFFDGAKAFFGGIGFIVGRPAMWGWALIPVIVASALFGGLGALAIWGGSEAAARMVENVAGLWTLKVLFWIVGLLFAFIFALSFAQPLSGFALDAIARRQELALGGRAHPGHPFFASLLRSLRVTLAALAVTLPILGLLSLVTLLFPPASVVTVPLKFVVAGFAITYDFLDYPLGLRGAGVRARGAFLRAHFGAMLGFGLSAAAILLIPGVGLLLLPFGVAGATRMVVLADRPANV